MEKQKNIPQLRFPEFKGEWESIKLGDYISITSGNSPSLYDLSDEGIYPFLKVEELNNCDKYQINSRFYTNDSKNLIEENSIIFPKRGAAILINKIRINAVPAQMDSNLMAIKPNNENLNHEFLFYVINKEKLYKIADTSTIPQINNKHIEPYRFYIPKRDEQIKIATFFTSIDQKITQLKRKLTLLEQYKKGVMQKIFSQEIRFKDDNGQEFPKWEKRKIRELFRVTRGNVLATNNLKSEKEFAFCYPVYSSQTTNNGLLGYYNDYLFEDCITWTTDGANAGDVNYRKGKFYCTNVCGVLESKEGYANQCIAEILNSIAKRHVAYVGNPKLMNNVMAGIEINIPASITEQIKISNFLSAIDDKINHTQKQVEKAEVWKKGLMQQMFC